MAQVQALLRHQHKNTIQALSWSPNGNMVASASRDQTVRVFDIRAMKEYRVLKGHKKEVCCMLFHSGTFYLLAKLILSGDMAPCASSSRLRGLRRRHPTLGSRHARTDLRTAHLPTPCYAFPGTRLKRMVTRIPPSRASPCECFKRSYHAFLVP